MEPTTPSDTLRANISWLMDHYALSENALARVAAMTQSTLQRVMKMGSEPRTPTLERLGKPFGLTAEQLRSATLIDDIRAVRIQLPTEPEQQLSEPVPLRMRSPEPRIVHLDSEARKARLLAQRGNAAFKFGDEIDLAPAFNTAGKSRAIIVVHRLNQALRALGVHPDLPDYQKMVELALARPDSIALLEIIVRAKGEKP